MIVAISARILIFALPVSALAEERVDLFDTQGRRTGYVIVDERTGRLDIYRGQRSLREGKPPGAIGAGAL